MRVHVIRVEGDAKFWLEPEVELARNHALSRNQLKDAEIMVEKYQIEFRAVWHQHFGSPGHEHLGARRLAARRRRGDFPLL